MVCHWLGDTHGGCAVIDRINNIFCLNSNCIPEETGIIILGDAGLNFWLDKIDDYYKKYIIQGCYIYCVRGNHEERPENLGYKVSWDENVKGNVYIDSINIKIRYFLDGGEYNINGHSVLIIGGAYSIDKYWRLQRAAATSQSFSGWFKDEQLTVEEMEAISNKVANKEYDFVFTHTCPRSWEPTDLFLKGVNQTQVDKTMENWMDELKETFSWKIWCFGHFHADRTERTCVEQFFRSFENLENIWGKWVKEK